MQGTDGGQQQLGNKNKTVEELFCFCLVILVWSEVSDLSES